jgi:16S rRNA (guanine527-N7)-methyltransferase
MELLLEHFPKLTEQQIAQFEQLGPLYREWNDKINVISRKDIEQLYPHHILHALAIPKVVKFRSGAKVLDLGTGGGLPGIPLAILYPNVQFTLIDGTRKKIKVVQEIIDTIGLENAQAKHIRAEELKDRFDFVVCRAVASLEKLVPWTQRLLRREERHALPNGLLTLKGGDLKNEVKALGKGPYVELFPITDFFEMDYYIEKYVVYVQG